MSENKSYGVNEMYCQKVQVTGNLTKNLKDENTVCFPDGSTLTTFDIALGGMDKWSKKTQAYVRQTLFKKIRQFNMNPDTLAKLAKGVKVAVDGYIRRDLDWEKQGQPMEGQEYYEAFNVRILSGKKES
jgi:hypothetical protein